VLPVISTTKTSTLSAFMPLSDIASPSDVGFGYNSKPVSLPIDARPAGMQFSYVTTTVSEFEQPFSSVTVTVYSTTPVVAPIPPRVIVLVLSPVLQSYV